VRGKMGVSVAKPADLNSALLSFLTADLGLTGDEAAEAIEASKASPGKRRPDDYRVPVGPPRRR
jgi:hypothetical protein